MTTKQQSLKRNMLRSCRHKKVFVTEEKAHQYAAYLNNRGVYVKAYKCSVCKQWHVCKRKKEKVLEMLFKEIEKERTTRFS